MESTKLKLSRIKNSIKKLEGKKINTTYSAIANDCNMSKQRVFNLMKSHGLNNNSNWQSASACMQALKLKDTAKLTINQLYKISGYTKTRSSFYALIKYYKIDFKKETTRVKHLLDNVNTSILTVKEISKLINYDKSIVTLRTILSQYKIPFIRVKRRALVREQLDLLDTSKYTIRELMELLNYDKKECAFRNLMNFNKYPFKRLKHRKITNGGK